MWRDFNRETWRWFIKQGLGYYLIIIRSWYDCGVVAPYVVNMPLYHTAVNKFDYVRQWTCCKLESFRTPLELWPTKMRVHLIPFYVISSLDTPIVSLTLSFLVVRSP
ncbi:hypothetical protein Pmani_012924 [Petrolisthes manimaculis]|uniref:Uncharacterized protein n=1 Tax=Petrolisthes manimaculis TaxID=1843537 RepID=A0AAE1U9U3_9EUCA|nr:hypothetical protein Pmani_012924 [Petrolisthes manimaculis]